MSLSYGERLYGSLDIVTDNTMKLTNGVAKIIEFLQQRAALEETYAKSLLKLSKSYNMDAFFQPAFAASVQKITLGTEKLGHMHKKFAKEIIENVTHPLTTVQQTITKTKKNLSSNAQLLNRDLQNGFTGLKNAKYQQHQKAKAAETFYAKRLRSNLLHEESQPSDANKEHSLKNDAKRSTTEYKDRVDMLKAFKKTYHDSMVKILNDFQNNDSQLLAVSRAYLMKFCTVEEQMITEYQKDIDESMRCFEKVDIQSEITTFIQNAKVANKPEEAIIFEPHVPIYERPHAEQQHFIEQIEAQVKEQRAKEMAKKNNPSQTDSVSSWLKNIVAFNPVQTVLQPKLFSSTTGLEPSDFGVNDEQAAMKAEEEQDDSEPEMPDDLGTPEHVSYSMAMEKEVLNSQEYAFFSSLLDKMLQPELAAKQMADVVTKSAEMEQPLPLDVPELPQAQEYVLTKLGRMALAVSLNHKRSKPVLNKQNFGILSSLVKQAMTLAHDNNDANVGRLYMNMAQTFFLEEGKNETKKRHVYIQDNIKEMEVWKDMRFWEACFFDALSYERAKNNQRKKSKWKNLDVQQKQEAIVHHENMVFGLLGSFAFNMLALDVSYDETKKFVSKMCTINSLSEEYQEMVLVNTEGTYQAILGEKHAATTSMPQSPLKTSNLETTTTTPIKVTPTTATTTAPFNDPYDDPLDQKKQQNIVTDQLLENLTSTPVSEQQQQQSTLISRVNSSGKLFRERRKAISFTDATANEQSNAANNNSNSNNNSMIPDYFTN